MLNCLRYLSLGKFCFPAGSVQQLRAHTLAMDERARSPAFPCRRSQALAFATLSQISPVGYAGKRPLPSEQFPISQGKVDHGLTGMRHLDLTGTGFLSGRLSHCLVI